MKLKLPKQPWTSLLLVAFGMGGSLALSGATFDPYIAMYVWETSFSVALFGFASLMVWYRRQYLPRKNPFVNEKAIGWQLTVFFALIAAGILAWFISAYPADEVYQAISGVYVFTGLQATAIAFVRGVIAFTVGLIVFFGIVGLWVATHRSDTL